MNSAFSALYIFNLVSFIGYGVSCLFSRYMVLEFERYRLPHMRVLAGTLQVLSSVLLTLGIGNRWFSYAGAGLIIAMMAFGVLVRRSIGDSVIRMFPAIFYLIVNVVIVMVILDDPAMLPVSLPFFN